MAAKYRPLKRDFKVILCSMMNGIVYLSSHITEFIKPFAKKARSSQNLEFHLFS